jgi:hypothetical protein
MIIMIVYIKKAYTIKGMYGIDIPVAWVRNPVQIKEP